MQASVTWATRSAWNVSPPALEEHKPAAVVIVLGANDGLRKLPMQQLRAIVAHMIGAAQETGAHILLVGMTISPDGGRVRECL